jgi:hypothetical protein
MKKITSFILTAFILIACNSETKKNDNFEKTETSEIDNIIKTHLVLPKSLEAKREVFEENISNAQKEILKIAKQYNWLDLVSEDFIDSVMIFDSKETFNNTVISVLEADTSLKLPYSFSAALEKRILMVVSPEIYLDIYPQGTNEENYFEKLLIHEISHRLHVRILNEDEDAMGPIWFFEGFAIFMANQFANSEIKLSEDEIYEIVDGKKGGDYEKYGYCFKYFLAKSDIYTLIDKAGDENFSVWLKSLK